MFERLSREEECARILDVSGRDGYEVVFRALDVQFKILHARAQLLLGICGVLISTSVVLMTGKIIVRGTLVHERLISPFVVAAGGAAILSAAIVIGSVLRVRWMTQLAGADLRGWIMTALRYRDSKTRGYRIAIAVLLLAMVLFQSAALVAWVS